MELRKRNQVPHRGDVFPQNEQRSKRTRVAFFTGEYAEDIRRVTCTAYTKMLVTKNVGRSFAVD